MKDLYELISLIKEIKDLNPKSKIIRRNKIN